jgi:hypothetical protein
MNNKRNGLLGLYCLITGAALLSGCHEPPKTLSAAGIDTAKERARLGPEYWKRNNVANLSKYEYDRAAITEFLVEFVTQQREGSMFGAGEPVVGGPTSIVGAGVEASGANRKEIEYPEEVFSQLPGELYQAFVEQLAERNVQVVPTGQVTSTQAYQRLKLEPQAGKSTVNFGNVMIASDTGRILEAPAYSAPGLATVKGAKDKKDGVDQIQLALLKEVDADVALRVRILVGQYQERAAILRGSGIWVTSKDVVGNLSTERSLLSDAKVITSKEWVPVKGEVIKINGSGFMQTIRRLFPHYVAMGLDVAESD